MGKVQYAGANVIGYICCDAAAAVLTSTLCPSTCLPSYLPLASLANSLGTSYPVPMGILGVTAALLHVGEAVYAYYLSTRKYKFRPLTVALWTLNILLGGIFGLWVLVFPETFWAVAQGYCKIPATFCSHL